MSSRSRKPRHRMFHPTARETASEILGFSSSLLPSSLRSSTRAARKELRNYLEKNEKKRKEQQKSEKDSTPRPRQGARVQPATTGEKAQSTRPRTLRSKWQIPPHRGKPRRRKGWSARHWFSSQNLGARALDAARDHSIPSPDFL